MKTTHWIIIFVLIFIIFNVWKSNKKIEVADSAPPGKYSAQSSYTNITAMKHDIFKQLTLDVVPFLLVNTITSIGSAEFFSWDNFENTVIGKTFLSAIAYALFYQVIQPQIVNKLPVF
jgi:hypothetical protein